MKRLETIHGKAFRQVSAPCIPTAPQNLPEGLSMPSLEPLHTVDIASVIDGTFYGTPGMEILPSFQEQDHSGIIGKIDRKIDKRPLGAQAPF